MKQNLSFAALAVAVALFTGNACTNDYPTEREQQAKTKDAGDDLKDAVDSTGKALQAERDNLEAAIKRQEAELDAEIDELDRKIDKASAKEKVRWQERRNRLAKARDDLNADLQRVGEDMKDGWNNFKNEVALRIEKIAEDLKADK